MAMIPGFAFAESRGKFGKFLHSDHFPARLRVRGPALRLFGRRNATSRRKWIGQIPKHCPAEVRIPGVGVVPTGTKSAWVHRHSPPMRLRAIACLCGAASSMVVRESARESQGRSYLPRSLLAQRAIHSATWRPREHHSRQSPYATAQDALARHHEPGACDARIDQSRSRSHPDQPGRARGWFHRAPSRSRDHAHQPGRQGLRDRDDSHLPHRLPHLPARRLRTSAHTGHRHACGARDRLGCGQVSVVRPRVPLRGDAWLTR